MGSVEIKSLCSLGQGNFFVIIVLFLVTLSRDISLTTVKCTTFHTAKQLESNLIKVIKLYERGGFVVKAIFMNNEFKNFQTCVSKGLKEELVLMADHCKPTFPKWMQHHPPSPSMQS